MEQSNSFKNQYQYLESHKLKTADQKNLNARGIELHSIRCPLCDEDIETEEHIFVRCKIALDTWRNVLKWWNITNIHFNNLYNVIHLADYVPIAGKHSRFFDAVYYLPFVMGPQRSKEDHVGRISKSVFVTNFPDSFGSRDLWDLCQSYGKIVNMFIQFRRSKAGKRFAFVRFIRVEDVSHDI
ncbi:RNA-directed DNA polymerase, eukaryota, reverse transcriptase zinc-binding domain protein [Tanacetum coccineum]|uniref:RNA-directed DNA polymerase, eukaryota, reverse transcriptase zinc-binding domain protein n=1 Tax=Tanacetum coccineum TaxID=301880 RepID=A0ABQ4XXA5_9ASTR